MLDHRTRKVVQENVAFAASVFAIGIVALATLYLSPDDAKKPGELMEKARMDAR